MRAGSGSPEPAGPASPATTVSERPLAGVRIPARGRHRSRWLLVLGAAIAVVLLRLFVLQVFWVPTGSMQPTLVSGDRVLVNKAAYWLREPRVGDLVVFRAADHEDLVKRVVALAWPLGRLGWL